MRPWPPTCAPCSATEIGRFSEHVTRVEVHVADVNSHKITGGDKRCLMEARVAGRQPIAVSENAGPVRQAVAGTAHKFKRALDSTLGKLASRERGVSSPRHQRRRQATTGSSISAKSSTPAGAGYLIA